MTEIGPTRFLVALVMVAGAAIATWQFSAAGGAWQETVRQEIQRSAALLEDVRFVYADEAPAAFRAAIAEIRADRLRVVEPPSRLAASEYVLASQTAFSLTSAAAPDSLLSDRGDLGYDVPARLAGVRGREPALRDLEPDLTLAAADRYAARGSAVALAVLALSAAVVAAALRRRSFRLNGSVLAAAQLVAWMLLVVLPLASLWMSAQEQRAQALAARQAVQLSTAIAASGQRTALLSDSLAAAEIADLQATARELAALDAGTAADAAAERAVAAAEHDAAEQIRHVADTMGRPPSATDGVDAATVAAVRSTASGWPGLQREQARQAQLAEQAGERGSALSGAAAMTAIGSAALAAAVARSSRAQAGRVRTEAHPGTHEVQP